MRVTIEFDPTTAQTRITGAVPETEAAPPGERAPAAASAVIDAGACSALSQLNAPVTDAPGWGQSAVSPGGTPPPVHGDTFGLFTVVGGSEHAVDAGSFRADI